eukprot:bmy_21255T0
MDFHLCCWKSVPDTDVPWCFFPRNWGYEVSNWVTNTSTGERCPNVAPGNNFAKSFSLSLFLLPRPLVYTAQLRRLPSPSLFGHDIIDTLFRAEYQTSNRFHFKITDFNYMCYEVPHENVKLFDGTADTSNLSYHVEVIHKPFSIKIMRTSNKRVLNSCSPSVQGKEQFAGREGCLVTPALAPWPFLQVGHRPRAPPVCPAVPAALHLTAQRHRVRAGRTRAPAAPAQRGLEDLTHLQPGCRSHRGDVPFLLLAAYSEEYLLSFPEDYMDGKKDFTIDGVAFHGLSDFANELHKYGLKYVIIMNPGILNNIDYQPYVNGSKRRVWILGGKAFVVGQGYPGWTVFPDFTNPVSTEWWREQFSEFYKALEFDGVWI